MKKSKSKRLDTPTALALYTLMFKIRRAEEKVAALYPSDKIQSPIHLSIGQEAVAAGVCYALETTDHLYGTYRSHGIYIAKGGDLKKLFAELYAKDTGCARGKGGSMHLVAPEVGLMGCSAIVASTIPLAVGDALAAKMKRDNRVAVAFFGDGAVDEGVFFESLNFASLKQLPVIFVCENNNYAVHSKVADRHAQPEIYRYGEALNVPGQRYDGDDAEVVYTSMRDTVKYVREKSRPVLLEYMTYRWAEHVGPGCDHEEGYRDHRKLRAALKNDPLKRAKKILQSLKIPRKEIGACEKKVNQEIEAAVAFAEASPFPGPERLHADLFERV